MNSPKINFVAVVAAAAAMWVLGAIWYTAFSTPWMNYTGITEEAAAGISGGGMALMYGGSLLAYVVLFYVMAHFAHYAGASNIKGGLQTGFWAWLGFIATSMFVTNLYNMNPIGLWFIDAGYWLLGMLLGGVILVKMRKKENAAPAAA